MGFSAWVPLNNYVGSGSWVMFSHLGSGLLVLLLPLCAAACGDFTAAGSGRERAGTLTASPCPRSAPAGARCSTLFVYENRSAQGGRVIPLRIVVLPARASEGAADPVVFLAGGPGQAATDLIRHAGIPESVRSHRDFVFVDQRGTGGSNALTCAFYGPPMDVESYFRPFMPVDKVRECRERLRGRADLTQYTTSDAVGDLEEVRAALGYERFNLAAGSYGTRLGMEYVRRYEPRVRSVILEGVATPSTHMPENFGVFAQQALDGLLDECAAARDCAAAFPSVRARARAVFARLSKGPVRATVRHPGSSQPVTVVVTKEHVAETIRYMTYTSYEAARVPLVLEAAFRNDFSPIAESLLRRRGDGTFDGLYLSITCTEDVPFVSPQAEEREASTYLAGYRLREQKAACAEWPRGPAPEWLGRPVAANVPVLIISGALDPATPPANGLAVSSTLPNSLHLTIPFGAHSPAGLSGLECLQAVKTKFLEQGSVEGLDTGCVSRITRPPFATEH